MRVLTAIEMSQTARKTASRLSERDHEGREKEAQAKATNRQCPEFRAKEMHAKKQNRIRQGCTPTTIIQASEAFIRATKEGPDYIYITTSPCKYDKLVSITEVKINLRC